MKRPVADILSRVEVVRSDEEVQTIKETIPSSEHYDYYLARKYNGKYIEVWGVKGLFAFTSEAHLLVGSFHNLDVNFVAGRLFITDQATVEDWAIQAFGSHQGIYHQVIPVGNAALLWDADLKGWEFISKWF